MTSYDRLCIPKMAGPAVFSSMLYHADAIFFSQDALWLHINIQEARFQTVQALHGAQMTTINPVDLSRSFRFQSLLATASGTIINWTSPSGKIHDLYWYLQSTPLRREHWPTGHHCLPCQERSTRGQVAGHVEYCSTRRIKLWTPV